MTIPRPIHLHADYVHPRETDATLIVLSQYITRAREVDVRDRSPVVDLASYILRLEQHAQAQGEVVGHAFFCDGPFTALEVWRDVDAAARTKSGEYSKRGGRRGGTGNPRLAIFMDASLPLGIEEKAGIAIAHEMARLIKAKYGAAVEVACHKKDGRVDHAHFLISMRRVDISGAHEMIREFNGVASRLGPDAVGEERLSAHMEWMRATWARLLTEATGMLHDPRSFKRQGLKVKPLSHVRRSRIEIEKRKGVAPGKLGWREEHALQKARRSGIHLPATQSASFAPTGADAPIRGEAPPTTLLPPVIATSRKILSLAELDGQKTAASMPAASAVDHGAPARAEQSAISITQKQMPLESSSPQAVARDRDVADGRRGRQKPIDDGGRPLPASLRPAARFTILGEGAPEAALDKVPPPVVRPPSSKPVPRPSDDPSRDRTISHSLVLFGVALFKSRQQTTENIGRLADASGMDRSRFEEAIRTSAEQMPDAAPAAIKTEVKAQVGVTRADLLDLMEDIERERREAKAASRKKREAEIQKAENRRSIEVEGGGHPARSVAHDADPVVGPAQTAGNAEQVVVAPRADPRSVRPTVLAAQTSGDLPSRVLGSRKESEATPAPHPPAPPSRRHQETQSKSQPASREEVDTILDLAALLAWRGRLQAHLPEFAKICRLTLEQVMAEVRLRLQAFAQMKTPLKELWSRTLATAKASENPTIAAFVDAVTTAAGNRKPSKIERPEPATTDRDIETRQ